MRGVLPCPVFRPTEAEWAAGGGGPHGGGALLSYIAWLRRERADLAGLVRVVPPPSCAPPPALELPAGQTFQVS